MKTGEESQGRIGVDYAFHELRRAIERPAARTVPIAPPRRFGICREGDATGERPSK